MFLKNIRIMPSATNGLGVYAAEDLPEGTVVYQHVPEEFFLSYSEAEFQKLSGETQRFIRHYGFWKAGCYHIHLDDIRFVNDSTTPNLAYRPGEGIVSLRDIRVGEELTQNYADVADEEWLEKHRANYQGKNNE